jgi:hypothetical protein
LGISSKVGRLSLLGLLGCIQLPPQPFPFSSAPLRTQALNGIFSIFYLFSQSFEATLG